MGTVIKSRWVGVLSVFCRITITSRITPSPIKPNRIF